MSALTAEEVQLVRHSWALVSPDPEAAADLFYRRLFVLDPTLRPMFAGTDMKAQGKKLMQTLAVVVSSLEKLGDLVPAVETLGRRHVGYGVRDHHYATVGAALLDTLSGALGEQFTPTTRAAWQKAYLALATVMKEASRDMAA